MKGGRRTVEGKDGQTREYGPGEVIFREGDMEKCMYSVESGTVEISAGYGTESYKRLTMLEGGAFFGEMGMVRGYPRSATAVVGVHGAVVRVITWETLSSFFKDEPAKIVLIMQQLSRRTAELTDDYMGACGEIARLLDERTVLENRLRSLEQTHSQAAADAIREPGKAAHSDGHGSTPAPKGEDARLKKYMDAYRRYMNANGMMADGSRTSYYI